MNDKCSVCKINEATHTAHVMYTDKDDHSEWVDIDLCVSCKGTDSYDESFLLSQLESQRRGVVDPKPSNGSGNQTVLQRSADGLSLESIEIGPTPSTSGTP
ncbi:MAG: hypothetical protein ACREGB_01765 [Candidatus Saccharimonadales bacterium]